MGGLAQALSCGISDGLDRGLALAQLKRALRGTAFAMGAIFPLCKNGLLNKSEFSELRATLEDLETEILAELDQVRTDRGE